MYGTRTWFVSMTAVPLSEMAHDTPPEAAVALTWNTMLLPVCVPCAVPATCTPPAHDALKLPFALFEVFSVTDHVKFVHESGDGMAVTVADRYVPASADTEKLAPVEGPVMDEALRLNSKQPADTMATAAIADTEI